MEGNDYSIIRSSDADRDLVSIWLYGAAEWSPEEADRHLFELESAFDRLLADPELGRSRDELIAGMRSSFVDPHVVFYRIVRSNIEIVRVLHQLEDVVSAFRSR